MTEPVLELDGVDKAYCFFRLSDIRLRLEAGQIMGFARVSEGWRRGWDSFPWFPLPTI